MAIEPLKRVTVISPRDASNRLLKSINDLGVMELLDTKESLEKDVPLKSHEASTEEADDRIYKIDFILNLMGGLAPEKESFIKGLTPLPLVTSEKEINDILNNYDLEDHYRHANELDEIYRRAERAIGEIEVELGELEPIKDLRFDTADLYSTSRVVITMGYVLRKNMHLLHTASEDFSRVAWEETNPGEDEKAQMVFAFLKEDNDETRRALATIGFEEIKLPNRKEKVSDRIDELKGDLARYRDELVEIAHTVQELAEGDDRGGSRRALLILKAYWVNVRNRLSASTKGVQGKWLYIINGYIRTKDMGLFTDMLNREFPDSAITIEDPLPDEDTPVSISSHHIFRPIQLLTEMFGLPPYKSFDPTPFMQINFYVFFGICFSDVGYGTMLALSSAYLARKTKKYQGVYDFTRLLLYAGISSAIFGALFGSWLGDLYKPEYLGKDNPILFIQQKLIIIDPMDKTIVALIAALAIGVLNQFFGIALKMYGALRTRDFMTAFSDGICWIITLTGVLILSGKLFADIRPGLYNLGLGLFFSGAAGLILTQGREIKNIFGRLAGGVVSLYGIVGSYGITAFVGDTLSYCRLLALGLTTSIVAMTFNLMAGMVRDIPYVGLVLFVVILVVGHIFNFFINALGAFVHSMRLIFVEFFGRFYEGGARQFQPLTFDSPMCTLENDKK